MHLWQIILWSKNNRIKSPKKKKDKETFDRCIKHVIDWGKSEDSAYAICTAAGAGMKRKRK